MPPIRSGFSLLELLITLTLIAILAFVGLPSFASTLAKARQTTEINRLFHAIHLARKEAIRRRQIMTVCASVDGTSCRGDPDWSAGWILFNNRDRDLPAQVDPGEAVVLAHTVDSSVQVVANRRAFTLRAVFRRATNGTLVVCDRLDRVPPKALVISYTGRPRVATERGDGTPFTCAD